MDISRETTSLHVRPNPVFHSVRTTFPCMYLTTYLLYYYNFWLGFHLCKVYKVDALYDGVFFSLLHTYRVRNWNVKCHVKPNYSLISDLIVNKIQVDILPNLLDNIIQEIFGPASIWPQQRL